MKRHLLITGLIFFVINLSFTNQVKGQAAILALLFGDKVASEKFNISLEAGGVFSHFTDVPDTKRSKMGINFGVAGNLQFSDNWYFSPNIYFLAARNLRLKTYSLDTGNPGLDAEFMDVPATVDLRYIDIPLFFSFQTNNKKFRYSLGPQVSFLQSANATYSGKYGDFNQDFKSFLNTIDYGAVADFCYVLGKAHKGKGIFLHARYYQGFADIFNDKLSANVNHLGFFSLHLSLPFITEELAAKNLEE